MAATPSPTQTASSNPTGAHTTSPSPHSLPAANAHSDRPTVDSNNATAQGTSLESTRAHAPSPPHAADGDQVTFTRPLLSFSGNGDVERRPSVQFLSKAKGLPTGSPKPGKINSRGRKLSSPPPPPVFRPRVSFDTFDKPADFIQDTSFTLSIKHRDYEYTKRSRTFLCGFDSNDYSEYAFEWLLEELVDDGDEIVCLRVVEKDEALNAEKSKTNGEYRAEAEELLNRIEAKNLEGEGKAVSLVLEFAVGKVNKVIDEMINLYEPAILIVGTRGRSLGGFQGLLPGSVSKYCLQHSPVPVIVVRPTNKRAKSKRERTLDPSRHAYRDILNKDQAGGYGYPGGGTHYASENASVDELEKRTRRGSLLLREGVTLDADPDTSSDDGSRDANAAVMGAISVGAADSNTLPNYAAALPMERQRSGSGAARNSNVHPLAQVQMVADTTEDEEDRGIESRDGDALLSPGLDSPGVVMKSPHLGTLDSPTDSERGSSSSSDGDGGLDDEGIPGDEGGGVVVKENGDVVPEGDAVAENGALVGAEAKGAVAEDALVPVASADDGAIENGQPVAAKSTAVEVVETGGADVHLVHHVVDGDKDDEKETAKVEGVEVKATESAS